VGTVSGKAGMEGNVSFAISSALRDNGIWYSQEVSVVADVKVVRQERERRDIENMD